MNSGLLGFPNILGLLRATAFQALGKAGATAGAALVGGTTSGAPTSGGPFDLGDLVIGQDGTLWICTLAGTSPGSPGTFTQVIAGSVSGQLATAHGGTGLDASAAANGTLLIGNGSGLSLATLTAGSNVTLTTAAGAITVSASSSGAPSSPSVRAYSTSTQSIANNTNVALLLNSTRWDQNAAGAQHSTSSNTSRLTCQNAGVYDIAGTVEYASSTSGVVALYIRVNGVTYISADQRPAANATQYLTTSTQYKLAVSDYVELIANQTSGGNLSVVASANFSPEFMMTQIG